MSVRRRRARIIGRVISRIVIAVAMVAVVLGVVFGAMSVSGKVHREQKRETMELAMENGPKNRYESTDAAENSTESGETEAEPDDDWQDGDIRYLGKTYRFNEKIMTYLFMGVDKADEVSSGADSYDGGQSDALFLVVLDPDAREISLIGINRNTMTQIDAYYRNGNFMGTVIAQLTLQHGYGDGEELSCERTVKAVSNLFYGMPIDGYCALNMNAIPILNDAIGGVDVTLTEDMPKIGGKAGETVHLTGEDSIKYLRQRDTDVFGSADQRLENQKAYVISFISTALSALKDDITLPITLYRTITDYMVTDVTAGDVAYLATRISKYSMDNIHMYSLQGETVMGETFEEFYVDETALYELILTVFYNEVE